MFTLLILIPIAVAIDISQRVDKFLAHSDLTVGRIIDEYYTNFHHLLCQHIYAFGIVYCGYTIYF